MTETKESDAPSPGFKNWRSIPWKSVTEVVKRLQMRIAKAVREKNHRRAKALQWLLTHSYYAKLLAIRRVVENKGSKTPGVDQEIWDTPGKKFAAVRRLIRRGYKSQPLRRVYILKKNGKRRPLSIPSMIDRAHQALHTLALTPVAETTADRNSYGFREKQSCHDALEQCFKALAKKSSAQYVLEGDIKSCLDRIRHQWLLKHIPMDKTMLERWLKAGYVEDGVLFPTTMGTPQGGIASPCLSNMTLDGIETVIKEAVPPGSKVNFVRYADDFVVTGISREMLEFTVKLVITKFLQRRGLELSEEKTLITHIEDGFDFLGQNIRKSGRK